MKSKFYPLKPDTWRPSQMLLEKILKGPLVRKTIYLCYNCHSLFIKCGCPESDGAYLNLPFNSEWFDFAKCCFCKTNYVLKDAPIETSDERCEFCIDEYLPIEDEPAWDDELEWLDDEYYDEEFG